MVTAISFVCLIKCDDFYDFASATFICGTVITVLMLIFVVVSNVNITGQWRQNYEVYKSLVYQYENELYENDNDLGKKELYNQIEEWNSNLAFNKEIQRNFWVGIFYPNIYDDLEFIELK